MKAFFSQGVFWDMAPIWLGVTVENQANLWRIQKMLEIPAKVHFVSAEPLLEHLNIVDYSVPGGKFPDQIIVGCESGPGRRKCDLAWVRSIRDQCKSAGVAFYLKQIEVNGRVSRDPAEWPADLRIREFPKKGTENV